MALSDKTLICVECGGEFTFTAGGQGVFYRLLYATDAGDERARVDVWGGGYH